KECGHGQDALRDFMANQGVIPPSGRPTPRELAESMTPGEAKALVQELVKLYTVRPDRLQVFKALYATCKSVVDQMKSAAQEHLKKPGESERSRPVRSTSSMPSWCVRGFF